MRNIKHLKDAIEKRILKREQIDGDREVRGIMEDARMIKIEADRVIKETECARMLEELRELKAWHKKHQTIDSQQAERGPMPKGGKETDVGEEIVSAGASSCAKIF